MAVLLTTRSASGTTPVLVLALSLPELESAWSALAVAVLVIVWPAANLSTCTATYTVLLWPAYSVPTLQVTMPPESAQLALDALALKVSSVGTATGSVICTLVASRGPLFLTCRVKVNIPPAPMEDGALLLSSNSASNMAGSAVVTVVWAVALLFPLCESGELAVAVTSLVSVAPWARL